MTKIQRNIYGSIYAFYYDWLYFENSVYDKVKLKQNVYTGEVRKIHDSGNILVGFYI